jgi:hypothetical protein
MTLHFSFRYIFVDKERRTKKNGEVLLQLLVNETIHEKELYMTEKTSTRVQRNSFLVENTNGLHPPIW